jgi:hypothetical protein
MAFDPPLDVNPMPIRDDCNCEQAERLKARVLELEELVEASTKELAKRDELLGYVRGSINRVLMPAAPAAAPHLPPLPHTCPGCGFVMCEEFDERPITPLATALVPNGKYVCRSGRCARSAGR